MLVAPFVLTLALVPADHRLEAVSAKVAAAALPKQKVMVLPGGAGPVPIVAPGGFMVVPPPVPGGTSSKLAVGGPADESVLKNAKLATTDDALLEFFRKRTPPSPPRERIDELVKKLSAKE